MATLKLSPKQPAPKITRKPGIVDGKPVQKVKGNHVYIHARDITPDDKISAGLLVNGVLQTESVTAPWVATAQPGKYPRASIRLLVGDDCDEITFDAVEPT